MGKHVFKKPEPVNVRGLCVNCHTNLQETLGNGRYKAICRKCHLARVTKKILFRKPEAKEIQGRCVKCDTNPQRPTKGGNFGALCQKCHKERYPRYSRIYGALAYRKHKKDFCEKCGFEPEHPSQLDVDHIDGDRSNNTEENLQTLCVNCHRIKTQFQLWGRPAQSTNKNRLSSRYRYRLYKKEFCEDCGFVALDKSQLDVDHVDGDCRNNSEENFRTLCGNCHRLKTYRNREHFNYEYREI